MSDRSPPEGGPFKAARDDVSSWEIFKAYYEDEEDDLYWADRQLALIDRIGETNWLMLQVSLG